MTAWMENLTIMTYEEALKRLENSPLRKLKLQNASKIESTIQVPDVGQQSFDKESKRGVEDEDKLQ